MASYGWYVFSSVGIVVALLLQQTWQSYRAFNQIKKEIEHEHKS